MPDNIVPFDKAIHSRDNFSCGNAILDRYFKEQLTQDIKKQACVCFVLADNKDTVKGFFTLSNLSIPKISVPPEFQKKLALYADVPVTLLGRLAVDTQYKGKGLGETLLMDALHKSVNTSKTIASWAVVVDPIDGAAVKFYAKYGFILIPDSGKMFLPMKTIQETLK